VGLTVFVGEFMATRGVEISEEQKAMLRDAYAQTGDYAFAAQAAGCSKRTAQRHLAGCPKPVTSIVIPGIIKTTEDISDAIIKILGPIAEHMQQPSVISESSLKEAATAFAILIDKFQLLTGQATSRNETGTIDPGKLTPEEREMAARIRRKLASEAGVS
jgi:hypothetical protein